MAVEEKSSAAFLFEELLFQNVVIESSMVKTMSELSNCVSKIRSIILLNFTHCGNFENMISFTQ